MQNSIIESLLKKIDDPKILDILVDQLSFSELQTLLLHVYKSKADKMTPAQLMREYEKNRFVKPSVFSSYDLHTLETMAYSCLPAYFEVITLSPVVPLGTSSSIAPVSQDKVLTTIRNTEVISDSTNALALECSQRRREILKKEPRSDQVIKLATSHQLLRTQRTGIPGPYSHFRVFALGSAGRSQPFHQFEFIHIQQHMDYYLNLLLNHLQNATQALQVYIILNLYGPTLQQNIVDKTIIKPIKDKYGQHTKIKYSIYSHSNYNNKYYEIMDFQIAIRKDTNRHIPVANGGFLNWTQQLVSNKKERFIASGLFLDSLCQFL